MEGRIQLLPGQALSMAYEQSVSFKTQPCTQTCAQTRTPAGSWTAAFWAVFFLAVSGAVLALGSGSVHAANAEELELEPLIVREPERREIKINRLDSENFELGAFGGVINVEDFGSEVVYGVRAAYHLTEDVFLEGAFANSTLGQSSFERISGTQILTGDQRDFSYYNVGVGYNILPGEFFISDRLVLKGGLYLIGGIGSSEFGGDDRITVNAGLGYRLAATDWLAFRIDIRDHAFRSDFLGDNDTRHNFEFTAGLSIFF